MLSRLQKLCDATIEATWLIALIVVPLFFDIYSQRVFEPDKISLLRSLALIAIVAWIVKRVDGWSRAGRPQAEAENATAVRFWRQPLVLPVLGLAAAYLLSTALSVVPRTSLLGSYQRMQGTFTMLSYMAFFVVVLDTLRTRAQWQRLQYAVIFTSVPIALYGVLQKAQLDSLPWGGDTVIRVAANMGNSIFVAAYLIMVAPLTLERWIAAVRRMLSAREGNTADALTAGALLFVLFVQVLGIIFTQSRGPWLGGAAGVYAFVLLGLTALRQRTQEQGRMRAGELLRGVSVGLGGVALLGLGLLAFATLPRLPGVVLLLIAVIATIALYLAPLLTRRGWRWLWLSWATSALVLALLLVALNLAPSLLPGIKDVPYAGRLTQLLQTESGTGRVRVLIWQGVAEMMFRPHESLPYPDGRKDAFNAIRPLVGYGPESLWVSFNRFYRPELGGLESRNASPDRAHNETFDSLANTGVLGFLAYIFLFGSILYYALHWLGLVQIRRDRIVFIILGAAGIAAGVLIPWLVGRREFVGVGVALGFLAGIMIYITYAAMRGSGGAQPLDRRRLTMMALLATVIAHFAEIHFGIAIAATRTYFFVFIAVLAVLGMGKLQLAAEPAPSPIPPAPTPAAPSKKQRASRRPEPTRPATSVRPSVAPYGRALLPYAIIAAIVLIILAWDFTINPAQKTGALRVFWDSWMTHLNQTTRAQMQGPGPLIVVFFTLLVGVVLAIGETWQSRLTSRDVITGVGLYVGAAMGAWLVYGLYLSSRLVGLFQATTLEQRAGMTASYITAVYVWMGFGVLALAAGLWLAGSGATRTWSRRPFVALTTGAVLLVASLILIVRVNINPVRADIYFKLGQSADAEKRWPASVLLYDKTTSIVPLEDYYQLFQGRALLESARASANESERAVLLDRAKHVLEQAQTLNPLNTDHTANLARYFATRSTILPAGAEQQAALRQSSDLYAKATALSPNAAHLQNEWSSVLAELGEIDKARERLQHSLTLDARYVDTYLRLGQIETETEHWDAALAAYAKAVDLRPKDVRGFRGKAFVLARMGRIAESISTLQAAAAISPTDTNILRDLAILFQQQGDFKQALDYAQRTKSLLPLDQQSEIDALIQQLQQQIGGS